MKEKSIGFELKNLVKAIKNEVAKSCNANLTANQNYILAIVSKNTKKGIDTFQKDIETKLKVERSTATEMLKIMEKNFLIERISVSYDKRLKKIILGEKGKEIDKEINRSLLKINKLMTKNISKEELDIFYKTLKKIEDNITRRNEND